MKYKVSEIVKERTWPQPVTMDHLIHEHSFATIHASKGEWLKLFNPQPTKKLTHKLFE